MAYYCDCVQGWKAKGHVFPRKSNAYTDAGIYKPQEVQVKADGTCPHCRHYAVWSRNPPATLQAYLEHASAKREEDDDHTVVIPYEVSDDE